MSLFTQFLFNSNNNLKASLSDEDGIKAHLNLILGHLGKDSHQFLPHPTDKGFFKLSKININSSSSVASGETASEKELAYFNSLGYYEKWHLTKEGSIYAYQNKARHCIYRTGRTPTSYSDIADQLPERDKTQILILNRLGNSYAFLQPHYMCLAKFPTSTGTCLLNEAIWQSKEYHRFYLEEDGSISAGHGAVNKELVLDRYNQPVKVMMEAILQKQADTLLTVGQFLGPNYSIKNEKILQYSYDQPEYRLTYMNLYSTSSTFIELQIIREELYGKTTPDQQQLVKLVNSSKLPTLDFNPLPYFIGIVFVVICLFSAASKSRARSGSNSLIFMVFSLSAYLTSSINAMEQIKKNLLELQKKQQEEERRKQQFIQSNSITKTIFQKVVNYAQNMLWEVWFESCQIEEWNLYAIKFIFLNHKQLKPKYMFWIAIFGRVFLIKSANE